jgi:hypothetical protein
VLPLCILITIAAFAIRTLRVLISQQNLVFVFPVTFDINSNSRPSHPTSTSSAGRATEMPGSIRTIDATSQRYDPEEELLSLQSLQSSPEQPVDRSKNRVSLIQLPPSPADSDIAMRHASPRGSPSATDSEERRITRNIDRGTPGDQAIFSDAKTPEQKELAKRKSQYYNDVFASREPNASARERVTKESPILADVRTNVIVSSPWIDMLCIC